MRLDRPNNFLEPVAVPPSDARRLGVTELAKPAIPFERGQVSQPPACAAHQDYDGHSVHRLLHQPEAVGLRPRRQANSPTTVTLRGVREMLDGQNRPCEDFRPKLVKQSFELAFPPAPVRLEDVRREEDEGTIRGFVNQIAA